MHTIQVSVRDKIATQTDGTVIINGNSDYNIEFDFDAEWADLNNKVGIFAYNDAAAHKWAYQTVMFSGNTCAVPILRDIHCVYVGVTAGNVRVTTPAKVQCRLSISDYADTEEPPSADVWGQILAKLDELQTEIDEIKEGGVGGTDISLGVTATVGQTIKVKAVDADGKPTAWEAVDMATGDTEVWELINTLTITEENAVAMFAIDKDSNGKPFSLKKATMKSLLTNTKNVPLKGWLCFNGRGVYNSGVHGFVTQNYLSYTMANYGVEWGIEVVPKVSYEYKGVSKEFSSTTQNDIHEIEVSRYQNNETLVYGTIECWGVRK